VSVLPIGKGHDHEQEHDRRRLLAVRGVRPDLESDATGGGAERLGAVTEKPSASVIDDLRELVAAIDRRVPRLEREGELAIARDALSLRTEALRRIAELEQPPRK